MLHCQHNYLRKSILNHEGLSLKNRVWLLFVQEGHFGKLHCNFKFLIFCSSRDNFVGLAEQHC